MSNESSVLYSLRPVGFEYKHAAGPQGIPQHGLIAEEVEKVDPSLVVHEADGKPYSVRYEQINAMLLNEFLKEHATVQEQVAAAKARDTAIAALQADNARLEGAVAQQSKTLARQQEMFAAAMGQINELAARVKEDSTPVRKASLPTEASGAALRVAANEVR